MAAPIVQTTTSNTTEQCPSSSSGGTGSRVKPGTLIWNEQMQTMILNTGMFGYLAVQVPMGRLAEIMNTKHIISISMWGSVILTALNPIVAEWNVQAMIVLQVLLGAFAGANCPPSFCLLSRWVTNKERNTMVAIYFNGMTVGYIVMPYFVSRLCEYGFSGGWPSVFYVNSIFGIVWLILWHLLATNYPEESPIITPEELEYITKNRFTTSEKTVPLPWKQIATSLPVWALCAASFSLSWPQLQLQDELPEYMSFPLNFNVEEVGLYNTIINLGSAILLLVSGIVADLLRNFQVMSITTLRKVYVGLAGIITAVATAAVPLVGCSKLLVTVMSLLCTAGYTIGLNATATASIEIAPKFSGTISALWNFFGSVPALLITLVISIETSTEVSLYTWGKVYYIAAGITIIGPALFVLVGSADPQPWGEEPAILPDDQSSEREENDTIELPQLCCRK